jgi:hypothetical protein
MKTIVTTLPIYDKVAKQAYERSKRLNTGLAIKCVVCPKDQLPSFQWIEDGATSVSQIDLIGQDGSSQDITGMFITLPTLVMFTSVSYFVCDGILNDDLDCGKYYLKITMDNASVYYSEYFETSDVEDCAKIYFYNSCDFYNILYQTDFYQTVWLRSAIIEPSFPIDDQGVKNGEGRYVRSFARQTKKYTLKTQILPDYMVDVFNRMRLHDFIQMTDMNGDVNEMLNVEVTHESAYDDGSHFFITLTFDFDETAIVTGCCNNIT